MTADDVKSWLTENEWTHGTAVVGGEIRVTNIALALAEARRALVALDSVRIREGGGICANCKSLFSGHEPHCVLYTMPRPKE